MLNRRYSDSLRAGRSGNRIPAGTRFSKPAQSGSGAHPASYTVPGLSKGVKRPGVALSTYPPPRAEVKEKGELYPQLWVFMACSRMYFTSTFAHFPNILW